MREYEFDYFLDAWLYCVENTLDWQTCIHKNGKGWMVL